MSCLFFPLHPRAAGRRRAFATALAAAVFTFAGTVASSVHAQSNTPTLQIGDTEGSVAASTANAMIEKAEDNGGIAVVIELRLDTAPEEGLSFGQVASQRSSIANAQRLVASNVPRANNVKRYATIPYMAMSVDAAGLRALIDNPDIAAITEDTLLKPTLSQSVPLIRAKPVSSRPRINGGAGWAVAVLDTGVQRNHPAFRGRLVAEACFSTTDRSGGSKSVCPRGVQRSTARGSGKNCPARVTGCDHGTHVAGIVLGNPRNANKGVAPKANLISMQVFSRFSPAACGSSRPCASAYWSDVIAALEHTVTLSARRKIASVNMSLGGGQYFRACNNAGASMRAMSRLVRTLKARRVAVVIASGNDGWDGSLGAPACLSNAVTVGSTTKSDVLSWFSNHHPLVDLLAPGSEITSAVLGGRMGSKSGTSMATPHVAGTWALLRKFKPRASVQQIESALKCTGKRINRNENGYSRRVKPRIDVDAAFAALQRGSCRR